MDTPRLEMMPDRAGHGGEAPLPSALPIRPGVGQTVAHRGWTQARKAVLAALLTPPCVVVLVGRPGTGKTLLLADLARALDDAGAAPVVYKRGDLALEPDSLPAERPAGHRIVLVDEADRISDAALARFAAQPGLGLVVAHTTDPTEEPRFGAAFGERRVGVVRLEPLMAGETSVFLAASLARVGRSADLIADDAVARIEMYSGGVPRLVNMLASAALFLAASENSGQVKAQHVDDAAEMSGLVDYAEDDEVAAGEADAALPCEPRPGADVAEIPPADLAAIAQSWADAAIGGAASESAAAPGAVARFRADAADIAPGREQAARRARHDPTPSLRATRDSRLGRPVAARVASTRHRAAAAVVLLVSAGGAVGWFALHDAGRAMLATIGFPASPAVEPAVRPGDAGGGGAATQGVANGGLAAASGGRAAHGVAPAVQAGVATSSHGAGPSGAGGARTAAGGSLETPVVVPNAQPGVAALVPAATPSGPRGAATAAGGSPATQSVGASAKTEVAAIGRTAMPSGADRTSAAGGGAETEPVVPTAQPGVAADSPAEMPSGGDRETAAGGGAATESVGAPAQPGVAAGGSAGMLSGAGRATAVGGVPATPSAVAAAQNGVAAMGPAGMLNGANRTVAAGGGSATLSAGTTAPPGVAADGSAGMLSGADRETAAGAGAATLSAGTTAPPGVAAIGPAGMLSGADRMAAAGGGPATLSAGTTAPPGVAADGSAGTPSGADRVAAAGGGAGGTQSVARTVQAGVAMGPAGMPSGADGAAAAGGNGAIDVAGQGKAVIMPVYPPARASVPARSASARQDSRAPPPSSEPDGGQANTPRAALPPLHTPPVARTHPPTRGTSRPSQTAEADAGRPLRPPHPRTEPQPGSDRPTGGLLGVLREFSAREEPAPERDARGNAGEPYRYGEPARRPQARPPSVSYLGSYVMGPDGRRMFVQDP